MKSSHLKDSEWIVHLSLLLAVFIWGINYGIVKKALGDFLPLTFNGLRFALASCFLLIILIQQKKGIIKFKEDWLQFALAGFIGNFLYQICFIYGLSWTLAGNTSLILAISPVFVALFSKISGQEKVRIRKWIGAFLSFAGIAFVVSGGRQGFHLTSLTFKGDMTEFLAAVLWSVYIVLSAPLAKKYGSITAVSMNLWIGSIFLIPFFIPSFIHQNWGLITWQDWGALFYSAAFSIAVGRILWYRGISRIGGTSTSVYSNLTPLIALLMAWVIVGEKPEWIQWAGAAAILSGVFLTGIKKKTEDLDGLKG